MVKQKLDILFVSQKGISGFPLTGNLVIDINQPYQELPLDHQHKGGLT
jgi:hypothetical protein